MAIAAAGGQHDANAGLGGPCQGVARDARDLVAAFDQRAVDIDRQSTVSQDELTQSPGSIRGFGTSRQRRGRSHSLAREVFAALVDADVVPGQGGAGQGRGVSSRSTSMPASARACHQSRGPELFGPGVQPGPAPPGQLDRLARRGGRRGTSTPSSRLDSTSWHRSCHAPHALPPPQVLVGLPRNTPAVAWRSTGRASAAWARSSTRWPPPWRTGPCTSLPSREIDSAMSMMPSRSTRPLARQPAHEIQLHPREAVLHRAAAAGEQVVVADLLADLLAHVVAGGLGGQRQARRGGRCSSSRRATAIAR